MPHNTFPVESYLFIQFSWEPSFVLRPIFWCIFLEVSFWYFSTCCIRWNLPEQILQALGFVISQNSPRLFSLFRMAKPSVVCYNRAEATFETHISFWICDKIIQMFISLKVRLSDMNTLFGFCSLLCDVSELVGNRMGGTEEELN